MSTHNIGFYEEISKIIPNYHQISSNTHLFSSSAFCTKGADQPERPHRFISNFFFAALFV